MSDTEKRLAEIEARLKATTSRAEWEWAAKSPSTRTIYAGRNYVIARDLYNEDAEFIVAAHEDDIPWLVARVKRLEEALDHYRHCRHGCIDCFCVVDSRQALEGD